MSSYLPGAEGDLDGWVANFHSYALANLANLGINPLEPLWTNFLAARTAWLSAYPAHLTAQNAAQSARQAKDTAKGTLLETIRALVSVLQSSPDVSDAEREALGITVRDTILTPSAIPTSRPLLKVDTSQRLRHTVAFTDETTPTSIRKPDGVRGCELFVKIGGDPPVDLSECQYVATDTRTPYSFDYDGDAANLVAHWIGRWVNTRGETGPISETVSATVGA